MADLQDFIEDIITNNRRFCVVCFRTEKERKLVQPVALSNYMKYTSLGVLSSTEYVCIYCERQAEVALKLYDTLCFARHVTSVLWSLADKRMMTPKSIAYLLPSKIRGQVSGPSSVKRNKLLSSLRQYQTYSQTDVLVVDATGKNEPDQMSEVLVIEDDDEPRPNMPRLVPIEKLLQPQTVVDKPKTIDKDNMLLLPIKPPESTDNQYIILPNNSKIVIPNAQLQIDGQPLNTVNNSIPVLLSNGRIVSMSQTTNHPILLPRQDNAVQKKTMTVNELINVKKIDTVQEIILPDKGKIGEKVLSSTVLPESISFGSQMAKSSDIMGRTMDNLSRMEENVSRIGDNTSMCQITDLRSLKDNEVPQNPPQTKSGRTIDWEDKIPMDVISFMDAFDPIAKKLGAKRNEAVKTLKHSVTPTQTVTPSTPAIPTTTPIPTPITPIAIINDQAPTNPRILNFESPGVTNESTYLLTPIKKGRPVHRRKRKSEDDDVIIIC